MQRSVVNSGLKLSLVVLSSQHFAKTTGPCLATLQPALDDPRIELILVDNGSTDASEQHSAAWARQHPKVHFLPMPRDLGFAGGMNMGVSIATGEWICLVDSATLFPPGALDALLAALAHAPPKVAMLGPVSNAAGNGQRLALPDPSLTHALAVGANAMRSPTGLFTPTYRTDFFCVAIQRSVWHQLGGLDTGFGRGDAGDFDFSLRLRAVGRQQAIAEDVFVAHAGRAASDDAQVSGVLRRHRKQLRERHPQVRFEAARKGNEQALRYLVVTALAKGWTPALRERAAWRLAALLWDEPRNPLTRWRWRWATRDLRRALLAAGIAPQFPVPPSSVVA